MTGIQAVIIVLAFILILCVILAIRSEKKNYNNGVCPNCNIALRNFAQDSQGGRGYTCDKCDYTTWCSYKCVDRQ